MLFKEFLEQWDNILDHLPPGDFGENKNEQLRYMFEKHIKQCKIQRMNTNEKNTTI